MADGDLASLADLIGHESAETTKSFYAVFEQGDLRRKHDRFSATRWGTYGYNLIFRGASSRRWQRKAIFLQYYWLRHDFTTPITQLD